MKRIIKAKFDFSCPDSQESGAEHLELRRVPENPTQEPPAPDPSSKNTSSESSADEEKNAARKIWFEAGHF